MNIQVFKESVEWKGESWKKKEVPTSSDDETQKAASCT
jgi:hypothetical protein